MTSQARDFDADLDFDRFGMTSFFEAEVLRTALRMSSSFNGLREIGFALAMISRSNNCYPLTKFSIHHHTISTFTHPGSGWRAFYSVTPLTSGVGDTAS